MLSLLLTLFIQDQFPFVLRTSLDLEKGVACLFPFQEQYTLRFVRNATIFRHLLAYLSVKNTIISPKGDDMRQLGTIDCT